MNSANNRIFTLEELKSQLSADSSDIAHCLECSAFWEASGQSVECPTCNPTDDEDIPGSSVWADEYADGGRVLEGYLV